jgi:hypothetical protein
MDDDCSVRITQNGKSRNYISYLKGSIESRTDGDASVTFHGSGMAITKVGRCFEYIS